MQRALLPDSQPAVDGITIGWTYQTGGEPFAPVGGDWLAFAPVANGCLGVAVGDVAGHGIGAVRDMARYRFALLATAASVATPSTLLERVDATARFLEVDSFSTCVFGVVDTANNSFTYACAGHLPPILVRDGSAAVLEGPHGVPLGLGRRKARYSQHTLQLRHGDVLALFTDGLVERRSEPLDDGVARLAAALRHGNEDDDLTDASRAIVSDLAGGGFADDVVLVLIRYTARL